MRRTGGKHLGRLALWLAAGLVGGAAVAAPPRTLPDWPCAKPDPGPLTAATLLPESPAPRGDWRTNPAIRALADFAAAPENPPATGAQRIETFARALPPQDRNEALVLLLQAIADRTNQLQAILREGIAHKVAESRLLAEVLAGNDHDLAQLPHDAPAQRRADIEHARRDNAGALGDRGDDAEMFCRRLDYTGRKAHILADAIGAQLSRP